MEPSLAASSVHLVHQAWWCKRWSTPDFSLAPFASMKSPVGPWEMGEEGLVPPTASLPVFGYRMPAFPLSPMPVLPRCSASGNKVSVFAKSHSSSQCHCLSSCFVQNVQMLFLSHSETKLNETQRITTTTKNPRTSLYLNIDWVGFRLREIIPGVKGRGEVMVTHHSL